MTRKIDFRIYVPLLTFLSFYILFSFRTADDNRLVSWQWVFDGRSASLSFLILTLAVVVALLLSKVSFRARPVPFLFFSSFLCAAFFWGVPEPIVDASRYFTQAKHLELYGIGSFLREWGKSVQSWTDLPLVPFLYGVVFRFFGESRLYVQILTTLLFSMTAVLTYLIGKELWDEDTGITGGMLLLGMPYLFTQVPLMLADVPTMSFLTLAVFAFLKGLAYGGLMIAVASFALFLAILSKYSTWPMLSAMVVICLVYWKARDRALPSKKAAACGNRESQIVRGKEVLWRSAWIFATALLAAGTVFLVKYDVFREQFSLLMSFQAPGLKKWGESFVSTFFFQIHPFISLSALFSFYVAFRKRDARYAIVSWLFILLFLFQVKRIRYTVPIFPMVALMGAYGLQYVRNVEVRRLVVLCAVLSSLAVGLAGYLPFLQKISAVNLKKAGEFVDTIPGRRIEVMVLPQKEAVLNPAVTVPLLDLFTRKQIVYRYDPSAFSPEENEVSKTPLRFTWEYKNPAYYDGNEIAVDRNAPVVIISDNRREGLPEGSQRRLEGLGLLREFNAYEGVFRFRTAVSVYGHVPDATTIDRAR